MGVGKGLAAPEGSQPECSMPPNRNGRPQTRFNTAIATHPAAHPKTPPNPSSAALASGSSQSARSSRLGDYMLWRLWTKQSTPKFAADQVEPFKILALQVRCFQRECLASLRQACIPRKSQPLSLEIGV